MMITKESDYGIRILRALRDGGLMTIQQVCERECIPKQFAYKILKSWTTPDWSRSNAAPAAAARKNLADITLFDVIRATDEEFFLTHCLQNDFRCRIPGAVLRLHHPPGAGPRPGILEQELKAHSWRSCLKKGK